MSAGFQPRRSLEPTKSGYATVLTGSKLQWGKKSPPEAKTQLNTLGFMPEEIRIKIKILLLYPSCYYSLLPECVQPVYPL